MKKICAIMAGFLGVMVLSGQDASAFPTLVNHGYTTCVTCHLSPSGGGILNSYGKFVSNELFSVWDDSSSALPWITKPEKPTGFSMMGMGRVVQTYFDTPVLKRGDFRKMQADLELGYQGDRFFGAIAGGPRLDSASPDQGNYDLFIRRFYLGSVSLNHAVRVGKFFPEFGINYYNHNIPTRKGLYFNHNEEPYLIQGSLFSSTFDLTLGLLRGASNTELSGQNGVNFNAIYKLGSSRSGVSFLSTESSGYSASVHTQTGFLRYGYLLAEVSQKVKQESDGSESRVLASFGEIGWELSRGITPYLGWQYFDNQGSGSASSALPIGLRFYPFSHMEFIAEYARTRFSSSGVDMGSGTSAFLMSNIYF